MGAISSLYSQLGGGIVLEFEKVSSWVERLWTKAIVVYLITRWIYSSILLRYLSIAIVPFGYLARLVHDIHVLSPFGRIPYMLHGASSDRSHTVYISYMLWSEAATTKPFFDRRQNSHWGRPRRPERVEMVCGLSLATEEVNLRWGNKFFNFRVCSFRPWGGGHWSSQRSRGITPLTFKWRTRNISTLRGIWSPLTIPVDRCCRQIPWVTDSIRHDDVGESTVQSSSLYLGAGRPKKIYIDL